MLDIKEIKYEHKQYNLILNLHVMIISYVMR